MREVQGVTLHHRFFVRNTVKHYMGASDATDQRYSWSNWGSCLDLFAPDNVGGTSFAAPMVTAVAALYLQLYPTASPSAVESEILSKATSNRLSNIGPWSPNLLLYSKPPALVASIEGASTIGPYTHCSWYVQRSGGQPRFSYEWRRDGVLVSTSTSYDVFGGTSSDFELTLLATDGVGRTSWDLKWVEFDPYDPSRTCEY